jgi:hypothetical protein
VLQQIGSPIVLLQLCILESPVKNSEAIDPSR